MKSETPIPRKRKERRQREGEEEEEDEDRKIGAEEEEARDVIPEAPNPRETKHNTTESFVTVYV